ncbi:MAG TPA: PhoU domain-containing protein [Thermoplasmata archaeon]|nr:PhoU domain-containing protein [Thermoplasmata archaeon]
MTTKNFPEADPGVSGGLSDAPTGPIALARAERAPPASRSRTHLPRRTGPTPDGPADEEAVLSVGRGEPSEHVFRRLLGAYLAGAREFVIKERPTISAGTRDVVRTFCRRTRQPEIISDEASALHLRDLAFESPIPLDQRIVRMGRLVVDFHREAVESWSHLPFLEDGYWERRDDEIDREAWYVERVAAIRLSAAGRGSEWLGLWTTARSLERIADHAVVIGEVGRRLVDLPSGAGPVTSLRQFHRQAMEHLEGALQAPDGAAANDLLDLGDALQSSGRALADRLLPAVGDGTMPPATAAAVSRILESIGRTIAYAQDIAQVTLDRRAPLPAPEGKASGRRITPLPPMSP